METHEIDWQEVQRTIANGASNQNAPVISYDSVEEDPAYQLSTDDWLDQTEFDNGRLDLLAYAVWQHLTISSSFARLYVIIAAGIYALASAMRCVRLLYRQWSWTHPYATSQVLEIQKSNGALCLRIHVCRPWKIRAGQYIYLWIPFCSFWSFFQTHPFTVSWWDQDSDGRGATVYVLLKPMNGFTSKLLRHADAVGLKTWIDGPYGGTTDLGDSSSILMFASGIGIAAQVPYIKELLTNINNCKARTRSILLIWQLEKETDQEWVREWMDQLLEEDKRHFILRIRLYVVRGFENGDTSYGTQLDYGTHESIRKYYGRPHLEKIIEMEIANKRGRLIVTTSVERSMEERIQALVEQHLDREVRLTHLDFRPREYQGLWAPKLAEVAHQGVV